MAVVLITGCSSGFGLLTAVEVARRGHRVFATMRDTSRDELLRSSLKDAGCDADVLELDVTDRASVDAAIDRVLAVAGRIDVVVNNAGIAHGAPVEELDIDELMAVFDTNVAGGLRVIQAVLPAMRQQASGHIINVTSIAAFVAPPFMSAYAASKHAMDAIAESLASEVTPWGIHVTNVAPGAYETAMVSLVSETLHGADAASPYADRFRTMLTRHEASMRENDDPSAVADAIATVIESESPPARVVVPEESTFIVEARGAIPPEQMRKMLSQSYGV